MKTKFNDLIFSIAKRSDPVQEYLKSLLPEFQELELNEHSQRKAKLNAQSRFRRKLVRKRAKLLLDAVRLKTARVIQS
jgi:hypothetical protein